MKRIKSSIKIGAIYLIIGIIWIIVSDQILNAFILDRELLTRFQTYKGWFFVFISSVAIVMLCSIYERSLNKKIKESTNANRDLKLFFYKASHDLRGPIKSILGLTNMIQLYKEYANLPEACKHIETSALKADTLITDLNQLTNIIEANEDQELVNFKMIITEVLESLKKRSAELLGKISFHTDVEVDNFYASPYLVELIFEKIIENAVIYSGPYREYPEIHITARENSQGIQIKVRDNGIGINDSAGNQIFDMFFKGTEASKGCGLGLYIAKMAIERLNGSISYTSIEGKGTSFMVLLPRNVVKLS